MRTHPVVAGLLAGTLALAPSAPLGAQELTIGTGAGVNAFPFGHYAETPPNRYQQVYAASAFPGAILIDAFRLTAASAGAEISPGNYLVRFSTTGAAVDALSDDFDANLGVGTQTFFSGLLSGGLRIAGTPYLFDPALGNLLLDVTVLSQTPPAASFTLFAADDDETDAMSRAFSGGQGIAPPSTDSRALVTTFEYRASSTVPEPMSVALLGTGLAGVAAVRGRRRRMP